MEVCRICKEPNYETEGAMIITGILIAFFLTVCIIGEKYGYNIETMAFGILIIAVLIGMILVGAEHNKECKEARAETEKEIEEKKQKQSEKKRKEYKIRWKQAIRKETRN